MIQMVENASTLQEVQAQSVGMAAQARSLAWRSPQTEESGGLESTGSQRVRPDCVADASALAFSGTSWWLSA